MGNMDSVNREKKKKQLRKQMLGSQSQPPSKKENDSRDSEEAVEKAKLRVLRRRLAIFGLVVLLLGAVGLFFYHYQKNYEFSEYKVLWEIPMSEGSYVGYEYFGSNVLKYTRDGASYVDVQGNTIWTQSYEMRAPVVSTKNGFAAIADQRGNSIYICNKDGVQGIASTLLPISKVAVAGNGVVAAVLEEATASYISFFNRDGSALDIIIKTRMGGDGYPMDISLSQDGTQLICSFVYLQNGEMKSRVVFYDFSEIGKNVSNRLVAGFDENFTGTIVSRVRCLGEPYSCAFTGKSLAFFSSRNLASPKLLKEVEVDGRLQSIFFSEEFVGIIVKNGSEESPCRMEIYRKSGESVLSKEFHYDYIYADIDDDQVLLYNEDSCRVYNLSGVLKLEAEFDFQVTKIRKGKLPNTLVVSGPLNMKEIKMQ